MIKARSGNLLIFGLSRKNLEKLQEGKPIKIYGKDLNVQYDIAIFFGETEETMAKELESLIGPQTSVKDSRPH